MIRLAGLSLDIHGDAILRDVSLDIAPGKVLRGEVFSLGVGANSKRGDVGEADRGGFFTALPARKPPP